MIFDFEMKKISERFVIKKISERFEIKKKR
jgi:hypothetical protein